MLSTRNERKVSVRNNVVTAESEQHYADELSDLQVVRRRTSRIPQLLTMVAMTMLLTMACLIPGSNFVGELLARSFAVGALLLTGILAVIAWRIVPRRYEL